MVDTVSNLGMPAYIAQVSRGNNPNYMVRIDSTAGISITADMPENVAFAISSSWEPRFGAGLNELNGMLDTALRVVGENVMIQEFSRLMWMNTTPVEIPLTLMFDTDTDAYEDVFKPMNALELLCLPDVHGALLTAPGPSVTNPDRNKISIFIGRVWFFPSVVVTSVSSAYDSRMDARGYPISGQTDITFSTTQVMSKTDWTATQQRVTR